MSYKNAKPYRETSERHQLRTRRSIDDVIETAREISGQVSDQQLGDLLSDYVRKDLHQKRETVEAAPQNEECIGDTLWEMTEQDQEMFLFLLHVDGENISEKIIVVVPR